MYQVAIPSLGRAATIADDTLSTLVGAGVPESCVTVLAGPEASAADYAAAILPRFPGVSVVPCRAGLHNANARIAELFSGQWVVRADDDLRGLLRIHDGKLVPIVDADAMFRAACGWADRNSVSLWGVSPAANPLFMRGGWKIGLYFAFGPLVGLRPSPALTPQMSAKDDYERTLLHFVADGAVGRLNDVTFKTRRMRGFPGGLQSELGDRRAAERDAVARLMAMWPAFVHPKPDRDGFPEIALRLPKKGVRR